MKQNEFSGSRVRRQARASAAEGLVARRAVLSMGGLGLAWIACKSVPKSSDAYVALESSKFT